MVLNQPSPNQMPHHARLRLGSFPVAPTAVPPARLSAARPKGRSCSAPASGSAVALHRFGTRPRQPTRATMVRLRKPRVSGSRERLAHSRANEKLIPPWVGKIRLGPQRRRATALPDAGAFTLRLYIAKRLGPRPVKISLRLRIFAGTLCPCPCPSTFATN